MARTRRNRLNIRPLPNGSFLLFGEVFGKRIRVRSKDPHELEVKKAEAEMQAEKASGYISGRRWAQTWMTEEQQADVEAALRFAAGRMPILDWLRQTEHLIGSDTNISPEAALIAWRESLIARRRSARTLTKNILRIQAFLKFACVDTLFKISSDKIEKWVYRQGAADFTRVTDAQVLKAWLNFCVSRRWLAVSPFSVDMKDMTATARPTEAPRILSADQCHAYLKAALEHNKGEMVPYVILTTWCFMRESETRLIARNDIKLDREEPIVMVQMKKRGTPKMRVVSVPANALPILKEAVKDWGPTDTVPFSRHGWTTVRERAGLLARGKTTRHKRRRIVESIWQPDIARHTGFSYFFQRSGDINATAREAGTSPNVGFRHYLALAEKAEADKFYAPVR